MSAFLTNLHDGYGSAILKKVEVKKIARYN